MLLLLWLLLLLLLLSLLSLLGEHAELGHASLIQPVERGLVQWLKSVLLGHHEGWDLRELRRLGWWFSS